MPSGTHSPSFGELPYKLNLVSGYPFIFLPWLKQALSKDTNSWLSHRETHILLNHKPRGRCPGGCLPCWPSQHPNHFYSLLHQKPIHIWSSCFRLYHGHCCCCRVLNLVVTLDPHTLLTVFLSTTLLLRRLQCPFIEQPQTLSLSVPWLSHSQGSQPLQSCFRACSIPTSILIFQSHLLEHLHSVDNSPVLRSLAYWPIIKVIQFQTLFSSLTS